MKHRDDFFFFLFFPCSQRYPAEVTDLINEGEIGSGTCGQVFKVRFKKTGHVIAVKVRPCCAHLAQVHTVVLTLADTE